MTRLAPGWERRQTPEGREYFLNHTDKTTHWTLPDCGKVVEVRSEGPPKRPEVVTIDALCEFAVHEEDHAKVGSLCYLIDTLHL